MPICTREVGETAMFRPGLLLVALSLFQPCVSQILKVPDSCVSLPCRNGGTPEGRADVCLCSCPSAFTGLLCESEVRPSEWPDGEYATPMSVYGCPEDPGQGWKTGYINMTFTTSLKRFFSKSNSLRFGHHSALKLALVGPYGPYAIQMNFCFKLNSVMDRNITWPPGTYGLYRAWGTCPQGFTERVKRVTLPPILRINSDGFTPDIEIAKEDDLSTLSFHVCYHDDTRAQLNETTSWNYPFIFFKDSANTSRDGACPDFPGFDVVEETADILSFVDEDSDSSSEEVELDTGDFQYCFYRGFFLKDDGSRLHGDDVIDLPSISPDTGDWRTIVTRWRVAVSPGLRSDYGSRWTSQFSQDRQFAFINGATEQTTEDTHVPEVPWLLVNFGETVVCSGLLIYLQGGRVSLKYEDVPKVVMGDTPWAFLSNGGVRCDVAPQGMTFYGTEWNSTALFLKCRRHVIGQYLAVVFENYLTSPALGVPFAIPLYMMLVFGNGEGCGKALGMRDGGIYDFQLSASSSAKDYPAFMARPGLSGWCSELTDTAPYWQVDLLMATVVEGIQIYNWLSTVQLNDGNRFRKELVYMGITSFRLEHGFSVSTLRHYQDDAAKEFTIDESRPSDERQMFVLEESFAATLVRVWPARIADGSPYTCMRLELIGCRLSRLRTLQCSETSESIWTRQQDLFVSPGSFYQGVQYLVASEPECLEKCANQSTESTDCSAVTYDPQSLACHLYSGSGEGKYLSIGPTPNTVLYQDMCLLHNPIVRRTLRSELNSGSPKIVMVPNETTISVTEPGFISNFGYPFHYDTGVLTIWLIDLKMTGYVELLFTNISLNEYQPESEFYFGNCEDYILLKALEDEFSGDFGSLYPEGPGRTVLTATNNGKQLKFPTSVDKALIALYGCLSDAAILQRGRGFRALLRRLDVPNCQSTRTLTAAANPTCMRDPKGGTLVSDSFLGINHEDHVYEFWHLEGDYRYLVLTITDFDVYCNTDSVLQTVDSDVYTYSFCNLERPIERIKSTREKLTLSFKYDPTSAGSVQGFKATYKAVHHNSYIDQLPITVGFGDRTARERYSFVTVTVEELGKQYGMYRTTTVTEDNTGAPMAWSQARSSCPRWMGGGARLVTLRNKAEAEVVAYHLQHRHKVRTPTKQQDFTYSFGTPLDYAYIGLESGADRTGSQKEQWIDGSPATYLAWDDGEPRDRKQNTCTRMGIYSLHKENTWESIACDTHQAEYVICEVPLKASVPVPLHHQLLGPAKTTAVTVSEHGYMACNSGEFVSRLFTCDGYKDCLDGTDEEGCMDADAPCPDHFFQCPDGECVPISLCCDHVPDCVDGSDEYCAYPDCSPNEFECENDQCIPAEEKCNYVPNCVDGSDEIGCASCANGTFLCVVDLTCIPVVRRCDGFVDCPDRSDETGCDISTLDSCVAWWHRGYRRTGVYTVAGHKVECDFDSVENGVVYLKFHAIEEDFQSPNPDERIVYGTVDETLDFFTYRHCYRSVLEICQPPQDKIAELEGIGNNRGLWPCLCIRHYTMDNGVWLTEACSNETQKEEDKHGLNWLRDRSVYAFEFIVSRRYDKYGPDDKVKKLKFEPIVCNEEFVSAGDMFVCGKGNLVPQETRCRYGHGINGLITGCRDLTHLQNCEDEGCPEGFVKCPNSYCLSASLLCDGVKQCPQGEDEANCGCGDQPARVVLLYAKGSALDDDAVDIAYQLFQHGQQTAQAIELLRYHIPSPVNQNLTVDSDVVEIEYFAYDIRSFNQLTAPVLLSESTTTLIPRVVQTAVFEGQDTNSNVSTVLILLENDESFSKQPLRKLMTFNETLLGDTRVYSISVGDSKLFSDPSYRSSFPSRSIHVHFNNTKPRSLYTMDAFLQVCPEDRSPVCPNMYRCHASRRCLSFSAVCDGVRQCPLGDDERLCHFHCPHGCTCRGYSVDCSLGRSPADLVRELSPLTRGLDLHSNNFRRLLPVNLQYLVVLNLSRCDLREIPAEFLLPMANLLKLDLSFNKIRKLKKGDFFNKALLAVLDLTGNYELSRIEPQTLFALQRLRTFRVRHSKLSTLEAETFSGMTLDILDLSSNAIQTVDDLAFNGLRVKEIHIEGNNIVNFKQNMFQGVSDTTTLVTEAYKLCCIRPSSVSQDSCYPPPDEFSSCEDLMRKESLRFLLWIIGVFALVGNVLSLLYRLKYDRKRLRLGYGIFVTSLAISDFLMGVYLLIIATADMVFRGSYIWMDEWWRNSAWCNLAGVLATISCEASVLFMCLITLDRIIVIKYPLGDIRFKTKSAIIAAVIVWIVVGVLAIVPLLFTFYFQGEFYTRSGVCLALPLTRNRPPGWAYSTTLFLGFNCAAFLLIALGQGLIFMEVRAASNSIRKSSRKNDLAVARNLLLVVLTDFLCWFPISVMGLHALRGNVVSSDVYAWVAVLILPINSAINPFLYTFSTITSRKKFSPNVDEQQRMTVISSDAVGAMLGIWKNRHLTSRAGNKRGYLPLPDLLSAQGLSVEDTLRTAHRLCRLVHRLHSLELVDGNLTVNDIYFRLEDNVIKDMLVSMTPIVVTRKADKKRDILNIGEVVSAILRSSFQRTKPGGTTEP